MFSHDIPHLEGVAKTKTRMLQGYGSPLLLPTLGMVESSPRTAARPAKPASSVHLQHGQNSVKIAHMVESGTKLLKIKPKAIEGTGRADFDQVRATSPKVANSARK